MDDEKHKDPWSAIHDLQKWRVGIDAKMALLMVVDVTTQELQKWRVGIDIKMALLIAVGVAIGSTVLIAIVTSLTNLVMN